MKELIEEAVLPQIDWHLEVIPLSIVNMKEVLPKIQEDYEIIATTGITNPKIGVLIFPWKISFPVKQKNYSAITSRAERRSNE